MPTWRHFLASSKALAVVCVLIAQIDAGDREDDMATRLYDAYQFIEPVERSVSFGKNTRGGDTCITIVRIIEPLAKDAVHQIAIQVFVFRARLHTW